MNELYSVINKCKFNSFSRVHTQYSRQTYNNANSLLPAFCVGIVEKDNFIKSSAVGESSKKHSRLMHFFEILFRQICTNWLM